MLFQLCNDNNNTHLTNKSEIAIISYTFVNSKSLTMKKIALLSCLFALLFTTSIFGQYGCGTYEKDCPQSTCTPRTPTDHYGDYKCIIDCSFNENYKIDYWEVNGKRHDYTNKKFQVNGTSPGNYTICTYYWCNGYLYKCCQKVYCPPVDHCEDKFDHCDDLDLSCQGDNYGKYVIKSKYKGEYPVSYWEVDNKRYNYSTSSATLEATGYGSKKVCVYYVCNNKAYRCCKIVECKQSQPNYPPHDSGHCHKETFENYNENIRIAKQSDKWRTWGSGAEGSLQDAYVYLTNNGKRLLHVKNENSTGGGYQDIIYKLGNKTHGNYNMSMNLFVASNSSAYYNIQQNTNSLKSGGHWKIIFRTDGVAEIKGASKTYWTFKYQQSEWIKISMKFDTDNKYVSFYCEQDGKKIVNTKLTYTNWNSNLGVGGINFYAYKDAKFWVDNIYFDCDNSGYYVSNSRSKVGEGDTAGVTGSGTRRSTTDKDKTTYVLKDVDKNAAVPKIKDSDEPKM